jgi:hypothetical protein
VIALAHQGLGDLEQAEISLAHAVRESQGAGRLNRASLLWDHGTIALKWRSYSLAEDRLRAAADLFGQLEDYPTKAMVVLDLTRALLGQEKNLEAAATAMGIAEVLTVFRGNKIVEAAISELVQIAVRGDLSMAAVKHTAAQLSLAREPRRGSTKSPG